MGGRGPTSRRESRDHMTGTSHVSQGRHDPPGHVTDRTVPVTGPCPDLGPVPSPAPATVVGVTR